MHAQEITAYLTASHIAVVATINRHGHPHLTPNWYRYDGKVLTLITRKDRLKYLNWDEARRIIERYRAPDEVDDYVARWKTEPRVLITVTPEHIATRGASRR